MLRKCQILFIPSPGRHFQEKKTPLPSSVSSPAPPVHLFLNAESRPSWLIMTSRLIFQLSHFSDEKTRQTARRYLRFPHSFLSFSFPCLSLSTREQREACTRDEPLPASSANPARPLGPFQVSTFSQKLSQNFQPHVQGSANSCHGSALASTPGGGATQLVSGRGELDCEPDYPNSTAQF